MADLVSTEDGQTYERAAIQEWFRGHNTSPATGARLATTVLIDNIALRNAIEEWMEAYFKTIRPAQLTVDKKVLAHSSFKTVRRGTLRVPSNSDQGVNTKVAVLEVRDGDFASEVEVLIRLGRHPNLIRYLGVCIEGDKRQIITELAEHGSLADAMVDIEDDLQPGHTLIMLQQICNGMAALAAEGTVHRDLALRNILLFTFDPEDPTKILVKVSDFGLTININDGTHIYAASGPKPTRWMAPSPSTKGLGTTSIIHIKIYAKRCATHVATRGCAIRPGRDRIERYLICAVSRRFFFVVVLINHHHHQGFIAK